MDQNPAPLTTNDTGDDGSRSRDRNVLDRTAAHLYERYAHVVDRDTVRRILQESYDELDRTAAVKTYLTASAGNFADSRLRSLAIARGSIESPNPRVLFVDRLNAGRSQMAASLVLRHTEGRVTARSAGLEPAGGLLDTVVEVMAEIDISLEHAYPKPLDDDIHRAAQVVVLFAGTEPVERLEATDYLQWDVPDLEGRSVDEVRRARDDIDARVRELIAGLGPEPAS